VQLRDISDFLRELPVTDWVKSAENTLRQLGLVLALLFITFAIVWFYPAGFSTSQRLLVLAVIGTIAVLVILITAALTAVPGDRLYSPGERVYGSHDRPLNRSQLQALPPVEPIDGLLEGNPRAVQIEGHVPEADQ
jgi:hypothetical protein